MADQKLSALTSGTAEGTDIIYAVKNPGPSELDRKIALSSVKDYILGLANTWTQNQTFSGGVNKVTITAPATGSTLTIADGKTLTANNTLTFTGTDSSSVAFGAGGTVAYTNATANGKSLARFTPLDNQPPASNFATLDTRNSVATLDFDDGATNEEAVFVGVIPEGAILTSGIKVRIFWAATSATSGACRWGAQFEKFGTDIDSDSFDTATEGHSTTSGTSGIVNVTELTCTTIDSLAAGDQFRIKIYRDSSDTTNDTMTGDAELIAIELKQVA